MNNVYLEPETSIYKWLFQLDDSKSLHGKCLSNQTSIKKLLFGVPGRLKMVFGCVYGTLLRFADDAYVETWTGHCSKPLTSYETLLEPCWYRKWPSRQYFWELLSTWNPPKLNLSKGCTFSKHGPSCGWTSWTNSLSKQLSSLPNYSHEVGSFFPNFWGAKMPTNLWVNQNLATQKDVPSLKLTFSPLKIGCWKTTFFLGRPIFFRGELLVSGSLSSKVFISSTGNIDSHWLEIVPATQPPSTPTPCLSKMCWSKPGSSSFAPYYGWIFSYPQL